MCTGLSRVYVLCKSIGPHLWCMLSYSMSILESRLSGPPTVQKHSNVKALFYMFSQSCIHACRPCQLQGSTARRTGSSERHLSLVWVPRPGKYGRNWEERKDGGHSQMSKMLARHLAHGQASPVTASLWPHYGFVSSMGLQLRDHYSCLNGCMIKPPACCSSLRPRAQYPESF